jgi:hypothetical protein
MARKSKTPAPEAAPAGSAETVAVEAAPAKKSRSKKKVEAAEPVAQPEAVPVAEAAPAVVEAAPAVVEAAPVVVETAPEAPPFVPTREQVARRAYLLFLRDGGDAFANWLRAEREVAQVAQRARQLWQQGSADTLGNWYRAESELA